MTAPLINLDARLEEVLATVGLIPSALIGALAERNRDFVDHHKRKTLKTLSFTAGDRARRMVASRMFGYGSRTDPARLADVQGESFFASSDKVPQLTPEAIEAFEFGRTIQTRRPMAIPIGDRGLPFKGAFQTRALWAGKGGQSRLNARDFDFIKNKSGQTLIIDARERSIRRAAKAGHSGLIVVGIIARRRKQSKRMGFYDAAQAIAGDHQRRMEGDIGAALTAAGRIALSERNALLSARRGAFARSYRAYLEANPRKFGAARRVAQAASRAVSTGARS